MTEENIRGLSGDWQPPHPVRRAQTPFLHLRLVFSMRSQPTGFARGRIGLRQGTSTRRDASSIRTGTTRMRGRNLARGYARLDTP